VSSGADVSGSITFSEGGTELGQADIGSDGSPI